MRIGNAPFMSLAADRAHHLNRFGLNPQQRPQVCFNPGVDGACGFRTYEEEMFHARTSRSIPISLGINLGLNATKPCGVATTCDPPDRQPLQYPKIDSAN